MTTFHACTVCGYGQMHEPPEDHAICPCCGTHFDHDDYGVSHKQLRDVWLTAGAPWFSRRTLPPTGWDLYAVYEQLVRADLDTDVLIPERGDTDSVISVVYDLVPMDNLVLSNSMT